MVCQLAVSGKVKNMSRKVIVMLTLCVFIESALSINSMAWDNEVTHKYLSEYAAENSVLSKGKGDCLGNLGFNNGLDEYFLRGNDKQKIRDWIRDGAQLEDAGSKSQGIAGTARYINHFHNPLKSWTAAGLDDTVAGFHYTGESSLLWAQDSAKQSGWLGGDWSWQAVRGLFYNALTKNTDAERQAYFAQMFRGLGHQIHLIQDASQPDHVRNDAHPWDHNQTGGLNLEPWAAGKSSFINALAANPIPPTMLLDPSAYSLDSTYSSRSLTPAALFVDTDQYNGSATSTGLTQGLAEYTNANFASQHTIFAEEKPTSDKHYFPYPRKSSTDVQDYINQNKLPETKTAEDGIADTGFWIKKIGDGELIEHFVKPTYLTNAVEGTTLYERTFYQDTECHKDYAKMLIPRAVGYSAALLDYFFRGKIDMVSDPNNADKYIIKNLTNEKMTGVFSLYYDNAGGNRILLITPWNLTIDANSQSTSLSFTPPANAKEPCKYMLVFKGQMGSEQGAVVGKVVKTEQCITGRHVEAYTTSDNQWLNLNVYTESGPISASFNILPFSNASNPYTRVIVRFNLSNYDELIVSSLGLNYQYDFHKFTINEASKTIHYNGIVYNVPYYTAAYTDEAVLPECGSGGAFSQVTGSTEQLLLMDFYYNGAILKPFGQYSEIQYVNVGNNSNTGLRTLYDLEHKATFGVYFGGKLEHSVTSLCTGGALLDNCDSNSGHPCLEILAGSMVDYYYPIAIYNETQYAYAHFQYPYPVMHDYQYANLPWVNYNQLVELASPAPLELAPWIGAYPPRQVITMLRKDAKQSFYNENYNYSYTSDEMGAVPRHRLISADNPYHKNIGWQGGDIIECSIVNGSPTCKTLKTIGGSFGAASFDVILKFP